MYGIADTSSHVKSMFMYISKSAQVFVRYLFFSSPPAFIMKESVYTIRNLVSHPNRTRQVNPYPEEHVDEKPRRYCTELKSLALQKRKFSLEVISNYFTVLVPLVPPYKKGFSYLQNQGNL